jgi:hypothetical protein
VFGDLGVPFLSKPELSELCALGVPLETDIR